MRARSPFLSFVLVASAALAGCAGGPAGSGGSGGSTPASTTVPAAEAPWWTVGEWWDLDLSRAGAAAKSYRLVNMWNDSSSAHFWLGLRDRALAVDHALFDTNPFLGRIHWNILAPHEKGMHAVMYDFPLSEGDAWSGDLLEGSWEFRATADGARPGALRVSGRGSDGSSIAFDYDPGVRWFTSLEIRDARGASALKAIVRDHGTGEKGTFWFERGRDYYAGPEIRSGTHEEPFTVDDDGLESLALTYKLRSSSPLELQVVDPSGTVRHREPVSPLGGNDVRRQTEIPDPVRGNWKIRFVTTGAIDGEIVIAGLLETRKEV